MLAESDSVPFERYSHGHSVVGPADVRYSGSMKHSVESLEAMVGSEAALGIRQVDGYAAFPDGTAAAICTHCARRVIDVVGRSGYFRPETTQQQFQRKAATATILRSLTIVFWSTSG